jgi:hypothetical protein
MQRVLRWDEKWADRRFSASLAGSVLLHVLVILGFIFWRPDPGRLPADQALAIAVIEEEVPAVAPSAVADKAEPAASAGVKPDTPGQDTATAPKRAPLSVNDLLMLAVEAHTKSQPSAAAPHKPGDLAVQGGGVGTQSHGAFGNTSVKDFIRAQVERRWQTAITDPNEHWIVSIRMVMTADGAVTKAEVVQDPRYRENQRYLDVAQSARNAVLLSSPLHLPPGTPAAMMDMVLDLDTRDAVR